MNIVIWESVRNIINNYSKKIPTIYQLSKNISINRIVQVTYI